MQIGGTRLVYASPGSGLIRAGKKIFGARVGKYKLDASAGKHKLGSRAGKYQLGARARAGGQAEGRWPGNTNTLSKQNILQIKCSVIKSLNRKAENNKFIEKNVLKWYS